MLILYPLNQTEVELCESLLLVYFWYSSYTVGYDGDVVVAACCRAQ